MAIQSSLTPAPLAKGEGCTSRWAGLGQRCTSLYPRRVLRRPSGARRSAFLPSPRGRGTEGEKGSSPNSALFAKNCERRLSLHGNPKLPHPSPSREGRGVYFPMGWPRPEVYFPVPPGVCFVVLPGRGDLPFFPLPAGEGPRVREASPNSALFAKNCERRLSLHGNPKLPHPSPSPGGRGVLHRRSSRRSANAPAAA